MKDCAVCSLPHQPDIHEATLSIHEHLRQRLIAALAPVVPGPRAKTPAMAVATIHVWGQGQGRKRKSA